MCGHMRDDKAESAAPRRPASDGHRARINRHRRALTILYALDAQWAHGKEKGGGIAAVPATSSIRQGFTPQSPVGHLE